jgi:sugar phosphate isomerase/epimerase
MPDRRSPDGDERKIPPSYDDYAEAHVMIYSLSYLTVQLMDPVSAVHVAARAGYQALGLRGAPAAPGGQFSPLVANHSLVLDVCRARDDLGQTILDLELIRIGSGFCIDDAKALLEVAAALGAKSVTVVGDDLDEKRLMANFSGLCEVAANLGVNCGLEYMPRTGVASIAAALRVVIGAGQPNGRIVVDPLHTSRTRSSNVDLSGIPTAMLDYLQICDAPAAIPPTDEELLHASRCERLLPGEGELDLIDMFTRLPRELPISIEVPHITRASLLGSEEWARRARIATEAFITRLPWIAGELA